MYPWLWRISSWYLLWCSIEEEYLFEKECSRHPYVSEMCSNSSKDRVNVQAIHQHRRLRVQFGGRRGDEQSP